MTPANVSARQQSCRFMIARWPRDRAFYLGRFNMPQMCLRDRTVAQQRPPASAAARRSKGRVSAGIPEAETARNTATAAPAPGCSVTAARPAGSTHRSTHSTAACHKLRGSATGLSLIHI